MIPVKLVKVHKNAQLPKYANPTDVGADLFSIEEFHLDPGKTKLFDTGLKVGHIPQHCELQVRSRSGLASKGVVVANSPGTIDPDYRGPLKVILHNNGPGTASIKAGDRIAQLVISPRYVAEYSFTDEVEATVRGEGGFGSTGS